MKVALEQIEGLEELKKVVKQLQNTVILKKYTTEVGNRLDDTFIVVHNLGTSDVVISVRETISGVIIPVGQTVIDDDTIKLSFDVKPETHQYTLTVIG